MKRTGSCDGEGQGSGQLTHSTTGESAAAPVDPALCCRNVVSKPRSSRDCRPSLSG